MHLRPLLPTGIALGGDNGASMRDSDLLQKRGARATPNPKKAKSSSRNGTPLCEGEAFCQERHASLLSVDVPQMDVLLYTGFKMLKWLLPFHLGLHMCIFLPNYVHKTKRPSRPTWGAKCPSNLGADTNYSGSEYNRDTTVCKL